MHTYQFSWNDRDKLVSANSEWEAKALFQERYGFWPDGDGMTITQLPK